MKSGNAIPSVAVVGTGYWGKNLVRNFAALGSLKAVCDNNIDTLKQFTENYPGTIGVQNFSELLNNPKIDALVIATPAETHFEMVKDAILAGKDVFVEKPLSLSEQEGAELSALAYKTGQILMVGHLLWYHPAIKELKRVIDSGQLGQLQYIYSNRLNLGKLRREENVLWSFAPHDISVIIGLANEMPDSVITKGGNYLHRHIADTTVTQLGFPSGINAHIFVSWLHPFKEQKLVIVGSKQMAVFDDTVPWQEKLCLFPHSIEWSENIPVANKAEGIFIPLKEEEPLKTECEHFLEAIKTRRQPLTNGDEGTRVLAVLNACQTSMQQGKQVSIGGETDQPKTYFAHETAVIDNNVIIGSECKIWHFSHLLSDVKIGKQCSIGQNVTIGPNVQIGDNCKVQNNVSIYKGVTLEDDVFCGPSMVFTNVVNPRAHISRKDQFMPTLVKQGCTIGANATIVCGVTLGRYSFIGAGSVITKDVPDHALMVGNPARQTGWMSSYGERLDLPLSGNKKAVCPGSGEKYQLKKQRLVIIG
ncbi:MAG: Gfo/Idh/MocA family oxidoreductase [Magnetococcales bacterium]|nr:Gfo/Idh/MocA family oxidoreductase [Magnetococcales bacterium]